MQAGGRHCQEKSRLHATRATFYASHGPYPNLRLYSFFLSH